MLRKEEQSAWTCTISEAGITLNQSCSVKIKIAC